MTLVAGKDEYRPGETAELVLANPFAGKVQALLTIERGTVLHHELMTIEGSSVVIRVPVRPEYVPNAFVSLIAVKGMDATNPLPSFRMGLARLNVPATDRKLRDHDHPRPEAGRPARHGSLEGVGAQSRREPRGRRPTSRWRWSIRQCSRWQTSRRGRCSNGFTASGCWACEPPLRSSSTQTGWCRAVQQGGKGGGGGGGGPAEIELRREFPDVAYWRASMKLDANGSAAIEVPFPDNLTTWVMDARACTEDTLLGQGRAEVVVSKELLLRPALPRFFVAGDRATIGATVQNNTGQPADVTVQLQVSGLVVTRRPPGHAPAPGRGEQQGIVECGRDRGGVAAR